MSHYVRYYSDAVSVDDKYRIEAIADAALHGGIKSKVEIRDESTGELIFEPLHNRTVISGGVTLAQKLFSLDRSVLGITPSYDDALNLDNKAPAGSYPAVVITDDDGNVVGSISDESQRKLIGYAVGQGGGSNDISDVFDEDYASWIKPDDLVPFRYPLANEDTVDEDIYKAKKTILLPSGSTRVAYYAKTFSNSPAFSANYVSSLGTFQDSVNPQTVYTDTANANKAQVIVESHLKFAASDGREFFTTHTGIEHAKINQLSLLTGWEREYELTKQDEDGNTLTRTVTQFVETRPFSLLCIPSEGLSDLNKSLSIVYTLYF